MAIPVARPRWWLVPLMWGLAGFGVLVTVLVLNETAREVLSKAAFMIVGAVSTPFILETSVALLGLVTVLLINRWRMEKEGDGWVYLAQSGTESPDVPAPAHRLDAVVLQTLPEQVDSLETRLSVIEGYVELGLAREALDQLDALKAEDQASAAAQALRASAQARLS